MKKKKHLLRNTIIILLVIVVSVWLLIETGYEKWSISAVCPKCLQHAYIREIKIHGITIYRKIHPSQNPGGIMSSAVFSPNLPQVSPALYEEIMGCKCEHVFKKGGFGRTSNGVHLDGIFDEWFHYTRRIEAITALYTAYTNTGNKKLTRNTYSLIDEALPIDDDKMYEANNILKMRDNLEISLEEAISISPYPEAAEIVKAMVEYETIISRLRQVENDDQWEQLLSEISGIAEAETTIINL